MSLSEICSSAFWEVSSTALQQKDIQLRTHSGVSYDFRASMFVNEFILTISHSLTRQFIPKVYFDTNICGGSIGRGQNSRWKTLSVSGSWRGPYSYHTAIVGWVNISMSRFQKSLWRMIMQMTVLATPGGGLLGGREIRRSCLLEEELSLLVFQNFF